MRGADLQGADLQGADLQGAYLQGADLQRAYLRGADLQGADLQGADLQGAYLQGADLQRAYLRGADLQGAYLRGADLQGADLQPIKNDMFALLLKAIPEVSNLRKSIIEGKIDGSTYEGECACLCGTLEKTSNEKIKTVIHDQRDSSRPIERFFLGIKQGDTPKTNSISKIALEWVDEFLSYINN